MPTVNLDTRRVAEAVGPSAALACSALCSARAGEKRGCDFGDMLAERAQHGDVQLLERTLLYQFPLAQKAKACQAVAELSWPPNSVLVPCTALLCFRDEDPVTFVHPWFGWDINFVEGSWCKCAELRMLGS